MHWLPYPKKFQVEWISRQTLLPTVADRSACFRTSPSLKWIMGRFCVRQETQLGHSSYPVSITSFRQVRTHVAIGKTLPRPQSRVVMDKKPRKSQIAPTENGKGPFLLSRCESVIVIACSGARTKTKTKGLVVLEIIRDERTNLLMHLVAWFVCHRY